MEEAVVVQRLLHLPLSTILHHLQWSFQQLTIHVQTATLAPPHLLFLAVWHLTLIRGHLLPKQAIPFLAWIEAIIALQQPMRMAAHRPKHSPLLLHQIGQERLQAHHRHVMVLTMVPSVHLVLLEALLRILILGRELLKQQRTSPA